MRQHTLIGERICRPLRSFVQVLPIIRYHHERWDGDGYPDRLRGEDIPLGARILGIAEIFDALTTSRPYQEKMPANFAVDRLRDLAGTAVDPAVFAGLEAVIARRQTLVFLEDTNPA